MKIDIQIDESAKPLNEGDGAALSIANATLAGAPPVLYGNSIQGIPIVLDNSSTHKTKQVEQFLAKRPRIFLHFTPTSAS